MTYSNFIMAQKIDLIDILQEKGLLDDAKVSQLRLEQINTGREIEDILREKDWVDSKEIVQAKAKQYNIPYVDLTTQAIAPEVLLKVPESVARHYILIPIEVKESTLRVAMQDPLDLQLLEFLETKTGLKIKPLIADTVQIERSINENYSAGIEKEVSAAIKETEKELEKVKKEISGIVNVEAIVQSAPVARMVATILEYAAKARASDIHIEPLEQNTRVRYRIDGVLKEKLILPKAVHEAVISRIKILSNLKIDEKRIPQDGRFMFTHEGAEIDLRVSTLPTSHGEKVVLRLLRKSGEVPTLSELGLRGKALKIFEDALKKTHGILLVTGPTGSGKTTTLRTALSKINRVEVNIITLEDPVEYGIPGINQVQINPVAGLTFASGLRSILRQDPNVIMVGEIRDRETMELAIQAALTGHLVFSTVHTNSAAGTLPRLLDMGAEPFLLASTMELCMAQRLVRMLCSECRQRYAAQKEVLQKIKEVLGDLYPSPEPTYLYKAGTKPDCKKCAGASFVGRMGIFEVLPINDKVGRLILAHETAATIEKQAIEGGMVKMLQDGMLKVLEGLTTVEEVLRVAQE